MDTGKCGLVGEKETTVANGRANKKTFIAVVRVGARCIMVVADGDELSESKWERNKYTGIW